MMDDLIFGSSSKIYGLEVLELSNVFSKVTETQYFPLKYSGVEAESGINGNVIK